MGFYTPSVDDDGRIWKGKLKDDKPHSDWEDLPPLQARPGVTALAGQALDIHGLPLARVALKFKSKYVESKAVQTDETGRFLLTEINAGRGELVIDGRRARNENTGDSDPKWGYGIYEYGLEIQGGRTNVLEFTIWLTKIDARNAVKIPSRVASEFIVTNPRIPGLELTLNRQ